MQPHYKKLKRIEAPNQARLLTFSCHNRQPLLTDPTVCDDLANQLSLTQDRLNFNLIAWVIMPKHVHILLIPERGTEIPTILSAIKRPFARRTLAALRASSTACPPGQAVAQSPPRFWQPGGGHDRNITERNYIAAAARYIHANPVRRALAATPTDYRWSSARAYAAMETPWPAINRPSG